MKPQPSEYVPSANRHPTSREFPYFDAYNGGPHWCWWSPDDRQGPDWIRCPYGVLGDRLWVRETWGLSRDAVRGTQEWVRYAAGGAPVPLRAAAPQGFAFVDDGRRTWRPSIHMPRWASRLTLELIEVRAQRLQDISEDDAIAEGCPAQPWYRVPAGPVQWFSTVWNDINGERGSWKSNPWVWALTFSRVTP